MRKCVQLLFVASFSLCAVGMSQFRGDDSTSHSEPEIRSNEEATSSRTIPAAKDDAMSRKKEAFQALPAPTQNLVITIFGEDFSGVTLDTQPQSITITYVEVTPFTTVNSVLVPRNCEVVIIDAAKVKMTYPVGSTIPEGTSLYPGSYITAITVASS